MAVWARVWTQGAEEDPATCSQETRSLPDETSPAAHSPWEQDAWSTLGGSVSESGVKSRVGAAETGQGLLLSFYNIFTRSYNVHNWKTQRHRESIGPHRREG